MFVRKIYEFADTNITYVFNTTNFITIVFLFRSNSEPSLSRKCNGFYLGFEGHDITSFPTFRADFEKMHDDSVVKMKVRNFNLELGTGLLGTKKQLL